MFSSMLSLKSILHSKQLTDQTMRKVVQNNGKLSLQKLKLSLDSTRLSTRDLASYFDLSQSG